MGAPTDDPTLDTPADDERNEDEIHRVLLVADVRFRGADFIDELRSHMTTRSAEVEVFVVAPALADSALQHEMADSDGPTLEAHERVDQILSELRQVGITAVGGVGDGDPITAVGDGLREFQADEVVMVSHVDSQKSYAEKDLWERLKLNFRQPISSIEVTRPGEDGKLDQAIRVDHEPAKEHTEEEVIRATRNFPPLQLRDTAGIIVGLLGTFFLGLIAVLAGSGQTGALGGRMAAIILIAIGAFLLNGANIVGLLFFQSVRYTGVWERFMARLALSFTTIGIIASLILWLV